MMYFPELDEPDYYTRRCTMKNQNNSKGAGNNNNRSNSSNKKKQNKNQAKASGGARQIYRQPKKDSADKRVNYDNTRESRFEDDMSKDHNNDVAWYAKNPELLKAAGSYGFSYLTGSKLPFTGTVDGYGKYVPGIMSIEWCPAFGGPSIEVVKKAADQIYNFTVHGNSRNTKYAASDMFVTIIATSNCFNMVAAMIRAFGVMKKFSDRNDYTPKGLVTAMGFQYEDLKANLSDMWFDINEMVASLGQLWLPKDMPYVARQFWMNSNVYTDAANPKAQYYLYTQARYFMYQDIQFATGTSLSTAYYVDASGNSHPFYPGANKYTWAMWKQVFQTCLNALIQAEDRGTMLGDILKAYGRENLYTVSEIPADYSIDFTYSPEVLSQIENCTVSSAYATFGGLKQDSQGMLEAYWISTRADKISDETGLMTDQMVLNFHQAETPTPEQIMVATRMSTVGGTVITAMPCVGAAAYKPDYSNPKSQAITNYAIVVPRETGTEVAIGIKVWYKDEITAGSPSMMSNAVMTPVPNKGSEMTPPYMCINQFAQWAAFDWAPWIYISAVDSDSTGTPSNTGSGYIDNPTVLAIGDYDNYTILSAGDLHKLHTAAVYSEFGVPMF